MIYHLNTKFKHVKGDWKTMQYIYKQMMAENNDRERQSFEHQSTFNTFHTDMGLPHQEEYGRRWGQHNAIGGYPRFTKLDFS